MTVGMSRNLMKLQAIGRECREMQSDDPKLKRLAAMVADLCLASEQTLREVHREAEDASVQANRNRYQYLR